MANYDYLTNSGVIVADTSDTRDEVVTEFRGVFGQDLVVDDETPEGAWINAETTSRQSVARNNASLANQINPNMAGGIFLDAIWALTGGQRDVATRSTVTATVAGVAGTALNAGVRASVGSGGEEFELVNAVTIPVSGSIDAAFQSVNTGPIAAAAGALNTISSPGVLGWETITNANAAVLGVAQQTDESARRERNATIGLQGRSTAAAVASNVRAVSGVTSHSFRENSTNATQVIDGVTLVAHSVWACVSGGANNDIALALLRSKTGGANWNGSQSVSVTEPNSGQSVTVQFERPTDVPIAARVTVRVSSAVADPETAVRDAIIAYAAGQVGGEEGFAIGSDVSPYELSWAVSVQNAGIFVSLLEVSTNPNSPTFGTSTIPINIDQQASIIAGNIQVIVQ